jgi:hypothetical protein
MVKWFPLYTFENGMLEVKLISVSSILCVIFFRRARDESVLAPKSKACREKMRRERLNDRYSANPHSNFGLKLLYDL